MKIPYLLRVSLRNMFEPSAALSISSVMQIEGYCDFEIDEALRAFRKERIIEDMFFLMEAPRGFFDDETLLCILKCDTIPKYRQMFGALVEYTKQGNCKLVMKWFFNNLLSRLAANEAYE